MALVDTVEGAARPRARAALFSDPGASVAAAARLRVATPVDLGYILYADRTALYVLATLLLALAFATALPAFILMRVVTASMTAVATSFQFAVVVALFIELATRFDAHTTLDDSVRVPVHRSVPRIVAVTALVAAVFSALALTNVSLGLAGCAGRRDTNETLVAWLFTDADAPDALPAAVGNATDWTALARRSRFAVEFHWLQLCLDERPLGIAFAVLCGALIVVDLAVAVVHFRMPYDTARVLPLLVAAAGVRTRSMRAPLVGVGGSAPFGRLSLQPYR